MIQQCTIHTHIGGQIQVRVKMKTKFLRLRVRVKSLKLMKLWRTFKQRQRWSKKYRINKEKNNKSIKSLS